MSTAAALYVIRLHGPDGSAPLYVGHYPGTVGATTAMDAVYSRKFATKADAWAHVETYGHLYRGRTAEVVPYSHYEARP